MGLDNIPKVYPCKKSNTAILDDEGRIDCASTILNGKCPYHNAKNSDNNVKEIGGVLGMLGTDCWYRGKYGNYLINTLSSIDSNFVNDMPCDFYGNGDGDEEGISADDCLAMSITMNDYLDEWINVVNLNKDNNLIEENAINDWIYAAWWLRFVSEYADGSAIWY